MIVYILCEGIIRKRREQKRTMQKFLILENSRVSIPYFERPTNLINFLEISHTGVGEVVDSNIIFKIIQIFFCFAILHFFFIFHLYIYLFWTYQNEKTGLLAMDVRSTRNKKGIKLNKRLDSCIVWKERWRFMNSVKKEMIIILSVNFK